MARTGPGKHRHLDSRGKWTTDRDADHTHEIDLQFTDAEVTALKAILAAGGSGGGTTPVPNDPIPDPPTPPPPLTGEVINPGTGTIAAAIALGKMDLVLRAGTYKDSFGSAQRTDTVSLRNYPGELAIIDGTGLAQNFLYLGTGSWTLTGIKIQGFRPTDSGVIGNRDGTLILDAVTMVGLGGIDDNVHHVYCFGNGTTTIRKSCKLLNAPGAAVTTYHTAVITPNVTISDSELTAQYRAGLFYDGTVVATNTRFFSPTFDVERLAGVSLTLTNCTGGGVGNAVRVYVA